MQRIRNVLLRECSEAASHIVSLRLLFLTIFKNSIFVKQAGCALCPHLVLCTVDLTKHKDLSLDLEKVGTDPYCEMTVNSKIQKMINVAAGTKASLSFLDCLNEDVRLTANRIISKNLIIYTAVRSLLNFYAKLNSCYPF